MVYSSVEEPFLIFIFWVKFVQAIAPANTAIPKSKMDFANIPPSLI